MTKAAAPSLTLAGTWIGATREEDVTHIWRVVQRGQSAFIYATVNDRGAENYYSARIEPDCLLINGSPHAVATFVDADHFVLSRWHEERDMLFSRQGLPELSANDAWLRYAQRPPP
jgi:hypothetical protein